MQSKAGPLRGRAARADAEASVTALYDEHALSLVRIAVVMVGDRQTAEDMVQEAFCGLYRRFGHLSDEAKSLNYVRSAVLNGCRSALRRRGTARRMRVLHEPPAPSAEASALHQEDRREVLAALRALPRRQREAVVLRFYSGLSEAEIAEAMGVSRGTVKSTTSRALAALGRILEEDR